MKIEVQYFPLEKCSGNLCKIVVETTDYGSAAQIVMNMFISFLLRDFSIINLLLQRTRQYFYQYHMQKFTILMITQWLLILGHS